MAGIEKIREGLYVKKSFDGYRVVHPYKNDDGSLNWFNIVTGGNWWNLAKVGFILFVILFAVWAYQHDIKAYKETINEIFLDPYEWCATLPPPGYGGTPNYNTLLNFTFDGNGVMEDGG